jgi:hypothetical protein
MKPTWYYNIDLKPQGPFSLEEMRQKIHRGEVGPQELIYEEGAGKWIAACEWGVFEEGLFPAKQAQIFSPSLDLNAREWVLLYRSDTGEYLQQGPFSVPDLQSLIQRGEISMQQYIWKSGLSGWMKISDHEVLAESLTL